MKLRAALLAVVMCLTFVIPSHASDAPPGCPRFLFCGCALSLQIFGAIKSGLNLARGWLRFPRAQAAPGMVAYGPRRGGSGHVFRLVRHVKGSVWVVYDPNSGGHRTRVHERSIAGRTIVNPGGRTMMAQAVTERRSHKTRSTSRFHHRHYARKFSKLKRVVIHHFSPTERHSTL